MKPTLEDGLRALQEATEMARQIRIDLTDDYFALIAQVEAMPQNARRADKSSVWRLIDASARAYAGARRVR